MAAHNPPFRYSTALVALHWFMAVLFVAVYASIELRVLFAKGTEMRAAITKQMSFRKDAKCEL